MKIQTTVLMTLLALSCTVSGIVIQNERILRIFGLSDLTSQIRSDSDEVSFLKFLNIKKITPEVEVLNEEYAQKFKNCWQLEKLDNCSNKISNKFFKTEASKHGDIYQNCYLLYKHQRRFLHGYKQRNFEIWKQDWDFSRSYKVNFKIEVEKDLNAKIVPAISDDLKNVHIFCNLSANEWLREAKYINLCTIEHPNLVRAAFIEGDYLYTLDVDNVVRKWNLVSDYQDLTLDQILLIKLVQTYFARYKCDSFKFSDLAKQYIYAYGLTIEEITRGWFELKEIFDSLSEVQQQDLMEKYKLSLEMETQLI